MTSIDMLGWTLFLGLSSFFTALSISNNAHMGKWIRVAFHLNAISCFIALSGYLLQIDVRSETFSAYLSEINFYELTE